MTEIEDRWVFTDKELEHPEGCNREDEFDTGPVICGPHGEDGECPRTEIGVIAQRNGVVTNRWSDGTAGVPDDVRDQADCVENYAVMPNLGHDDDEDYANNWRTVVCNSETGDFIRFLEDGSWPKKGNRPDGTS